MEIQAQALAVIQTFPRSKNKQPFLTLRNGRKVFFNIFVNKYGLDGKQVKYSLGDVKRRVQMVEFFDYFLKSFAPKLNGKNESGFEVYVVESLFFRMVLIDTGQGSRKKMECLSFYPK